MNRYAGVHSCGADRETGVPLDKVRQEKCARSLAGDWQIGRGLAAQQEELRRGT